MDKQIEENTEQNLFHQFKKNKILIIILIASLVLGLYLRFDDYAAEGYGADDMNTIPAAVFAYYPHDYFPGLVSTEPPLGNYVIGLGCMVSGEDFSGVSKVKPLFFPDRSAYIGEAAKNAEDYCWAPIYIFGIIFLIGVIIFAFSFFSDIYSAVYFIIFFIFFPGIIASSRTLKPDIILFTFVIFALTFLWRGYNAKKGLFKEKLYFFIAFAFLGLASATKFPAGVLIIFSFLLLLEKYFKELLYLLHKGLKQIDIKILENKIESEDIHIKNLLINIVLAIFSSSFFLMLFFNFSIKNLLDTYYYMTSLNWSGVQTLGFSISNFFEWLGEFLIKLNVLDLLVFLFSVFILVKIIFKKYKTKQEKFILYSVLLCFLIITLFKSGVMVGLVHAMPFMFGFFILMSLTFSDEHYSILRILRIQKKYFFIFLVVYTVISFSTLYFAPFHRLYNNPIACPILKQGACEQRLSEIKPTTQYLETVLEDDETFLPTGIYNFYYRYNDDMLWWIFYSNFKKQTGKEPRLGDYLEYYKPEGRRVRYLYTDSYPTPTESNPIGIGIDQDILKRNYKPNHVVTVYGKEAAYVYDLDNLIKNE